MIVSNIDLKKRITDKFQSVSRFAVLIGRAKDEVHATLRKKNEEGLAELDRLAEATPDRPTSEELTEQERAAVKKVLDERFKGNVSSFARAAGVNNMTITLVIGTDSRKYKRKSTLVKELLKWINK